MTNAEITALVDAEEFEARRHRTAEKPLWLRNDWGWALSLLVFFVCFGAELVVVRIIADLIGAVLLDTSWRL